MQRRWRRQRNAGYIRTKTSQFIRVQPDLHAREYCASVESREEAKGERKVSGAEEPLDGRDGDDDDDDDDADDDCDGCSGRVDEGERG